MNSQGSGYVQKSVYVIVLTKTLRGIYVYRIESVPTLFGKILHHWSSHVTYQTFSVNEMWSSIECADILNSFNDELENRQIDELVNEAILLDLPEFDDALFNVCV